MSGGRIFIGTSGWNYDHWKGNFYPESIKKKEWFSHYQSELSTVEINNTFYNLPSKKTFEDWRGATAEGFLFSVKASRYITHMKKLKDPEQSTPKFFDAVQGLGDKLGPVLFQLPPKWKKNTERLQSFVRELPEGFRYTFEFRDHSWFDTEIYQILSNNNIAFCIYHLEGFETPRETTADFVYIRLHGPEAAYQGKYSREELSGWAGALAAWQRQGKDVYLYFDNDQLGYAPQNALEIRNMVQG